MSHDIAKLEGEIKEYKLQVRICAIPFIYSADSLYSLKLSTLVYRQIQRAPIFWTSRLNLKKSFPLPKLPSQS